VIHAAVVHTGHVRGRVMIAVRSTGRHRVSGVWIGLLLFFYGAVLMMFVGFWLRYLLRARVYSR
jgi:hypothetical protein